MSDIHTFCKLSEYVNTSEKHIQKYIPFVMKCYLHDELHIHLLASQILLHYWSQNDKFGKQIVIYFSQDLYYTQLIAYLKSSNNIVVKCTTNLAIDISSKNELLLVPITGLFVKLLYKEKEIMHNSLFVLFNLTLNNNFLVKRLYHQNILEPLLSLILKYKNNSVLLSDILDVLLNISRYDLLIRDVEAIKYTIQKINFKRKKIRKCIKKFLKSKLNRNEIQREIKLQFKTLLVVFQNRQLYNYS